MNILVSNDDGISSEGILALAEVLSENNKVTVIAPDGNRSGFSHSLSVDKDLCFKECSISEKFKSYSLTGTPADCVKFAFHYLRDEKIDIVCSGVNLGNNLGSDTVYSGTVSAGLEGNFFGVPSIAFSLVAFNNFKWDSCRKLIRETFPELVKISSEKYTLNVNFPNKDYNEIKGVRLCRLGRQLYSDNYCEVTKGLYRLMGEPIDVKQEECDVTLVKNNFVSVTPIRYDRTDTEALNLIKGNKK